jgi:adenosylcobyric acid synthase
MSLNAAVTLDGGEIARSTAVQAAAAGIEPTTDMNPILLKPEAGMRSQVILRGRVWRTVRAGDYGEHAAELWSVVAAALDRLREQYDVVVAEGAGSPAEMNLRDGDLANMRVARYAGAAVVLVGDVDRGGVFAQLLGTLNLLPTDERRLVRGLVVNRFFGDPGLFADGVRFLERESGLPVFGVVPFVPNLGLAEEDAATLQSPRRGAGDESPESVADRATVAVIRLPHLANFDDFGPLERQEEIRLRYVERPDELGQADLVILPGSKSTIADLSFLRERGLAAAILAAHRRGTPIIGICGGFQMLGQEIRDPDHVESAHDRIPGLGLLPHRTIFEREKQVSRVRARLVARVGPFAAARGAEVDGYEIHAGRSATSDDPSVPAPIRVCARLGTEVDVPDGALSADGLVFGTYLHGLFENDVVRESLAAWLASRASGARPRMDSSQRPVAVAAKANPYDRWADVLEASLDVPLLLERCRIPTREGVR